MRPEKKLLVNEVASYLENCEYVYLADYTGISVLETAELRDALFKHDAQFHVVKNSAFKVAAKRCELPGLGDALTGPTAVIVGGNNPSGVAKVLIAFHEDKDKIVIKTGLLGDRLLTPEEITTLSKLPSLDALRGQLLGLLNTPAQQTVRVLNAVPQDLLNLLAAKLRKEEDAA